jgi:hypothetical protein
MMVPLNSLNLNGGLEVLHTVANELCQISHMNWTDFVNGYICASSCSSLPSSGSCGISAHSSPFSSALPVRTPPPPPSRFVSGLPRLALLASHFLPARKAKVFPKFLGNPSEHAPQARDSGGSSGPCSISPADAAFRLANDVGFHNHKRFRSWFPHSPSSRCLRFAPIRSPG